MATARLGHFIVDVARAKDVIGLGQSLGAMTHGLVDSSDIYRAGLMQAVSALDHYVHGVVLDRSVEILMGRMQTSSASTKVGLSFDAIQEILTAALPADRELASRTHVAQRLSLETFQRPEAIAAALSMVGVPKIWTSAFGVNAPSAKLALNLVIERRNRIVHQADSDPLMPGMVTPLTDQDALDSVDLIATTVIAIDPNC